VSERWIELEFVIYSDTDVYPFSPTPSEYLPIRSVIQKLLYYGCIWVKKVKGDPERAQVKVLAPKSLPERLYKYDPSLYLQTSLPLTNSINEGILSKLPEKYHPRRKPMKVASHANE